MSEPVRFETPENIELSYTVAGLGTRFVAWFVDNILMFGFLFLTFIVLVCGGVVTDSLLQTPDFGAGENGNTGVTAWFAGLFIMIWGLGSFFYYGLFELFMRGQTEVAKTRTKHPQINKVVALMAPRLFLGVFPHPSEWGC